MYRKKPRKKRWKGKKPRGWTWGLLSLAWVGVAAFVIIYVIDNLRTQAAKKMVKGNHPQKKLQPVKPFDWNDNPREDITVEVANNLPDKTVQIQSNTTQNETINVFSSNARKVF